MNSAAVKQFPQPGDLQDGRLNSTIARLRASERVLNTHQPTRQLLDEHVVSRRLIVSANPLRYWRACGEGPDYIKLGRLAGYDAVGLEKLIMRNQRVSKARTKMEETRDAP